MNLEPEGQPQVPASLSDADERAELLEDIRIAEEQIARGEGIDHETVEALLLARLRDRR